MAITSGASIAIYGLTFGQYVTKAIDPWVCLQSEGAEYAVQLMIGTCFISEWVYACGQLVSVSGDRCIELWTIEQMGGDLPKSHNCVEDHSVRRHCWTGRIFTDRPRFLTG